MATEATTATTGTRTLTTIRCTTTDIVGIAYEAQCLCGSTLFWFCVGLPYSRTC
jgi:hypothetical protein